MPYVVKPSYDQESIRINIDVLEGSADIYLTDNEHVFRATINENGTQNFLYNNDDQKPTTDFLTHEHIPALLVGNELITFKTYQKGVLALQNIQHRVIITIDSNDRNFNRDKFYVVIKRSNNSRRPIAKTTLHFYQGMLALDMKLLFVALLMSALTLVVELTLVVRLRTDYVNNLNNELKNTELKDLQNRPMLQYTFASPQLNPQRKRRGLRVLPLAVQETTFDDVALFSTIVQLPGCQKSKCNIVFGTGMFLLENKNKRSIRIERTINAECDHLENDNYGHNIA